MDDPRSPARRPLQPLSLLFSPPSEYEAAAQSQTGVRALSRATPRQLLANIAPANTGTHHAATANAGTANPGTRGGQAVVRQTPSVFEASAVQRKRKADVMSPAAAQHNAAASAQPDGRPRLSARSTGGSQPRTAESYEAEIAGLKQQLAEAQARSAKRAGGSSCRRRVVPASVAQSGADEAAAAAPAAPGAPGRPRSVSTVPRPKKRRCIAPNCTREAKWASPEPRSPWKHCFDHKEQGELNKNEPHCRTPGCTQRAHYTDGQSKSRVYCLRHKKDTSAKPHGTCDVLVRGDEGQKERCALRAQYGPDAAPFRAVRCVSHRRGADVRGRRHALCGYPGCQIEAFYGPPGPRDRRDRRCAAHRSDGDVLLNFAPARRRERQATAAELEEENEEDGADSESDDADSD